MKKIRLNPEALDVLSFTPAHAAEPAAGSVQGHLSGYTCLRSCPFSCVYACKPDTNMTSCDAC